MKGALKWVFVPALAVALVAGLLWVWELTGPFQGYTGSRTVEIEPGTRTTEVARLLAGSGVIRHPSAFLMLAELGRLGRRSVKAGEYLFDRPLSPLAVYRRLVHGDVYLHAVVIPEGSDRFEIARIVREQLRIDPDDFLRASLRTQLIQDLDPQAPSLEGYLFPDTYLFPRGTSAASVVARMQSRFRQVISARFPPELRQSPDRLHQVITLASLVEKETPQPEERPMVAGVFSRRLANDMPMQCDPTVVYAVRLRDSPPGVRWERTVSITKSDLELDSPYNTYRNTGLPPGPICSPGAASIEAALSPAPGDTLYFVSNNHGGHVFATTLQAHQRNVARYRKQLAEERRAPLREGASSDGPGSLPPNGNPSSGDPAGHTAGKPAASGPNPRHAAKRKKAERHAGSKTK